MGCGASLPAVADPGEQYSYIKSEVKSRPNSQCSQATRSSSSSIKATAAAITAALKGVEVDVTGREPTCDSASR
jgi:hypothetical protein